MTVVDSKLVVNGVNLVMNTSLRSGDGVFCGFSVGSGTQLIPFLAKMKFFLQEHVKLPTVLRQMSSHGLLRHSFTSVHIPLFSDNEW